MGTTLGPREIGHSAGTTLRAVRFDRPFDPPRPPLPFFGYASHGSVWGWQSQPGRSPRPEAREGHEPMPEEHGHEHHGTHGRRTLADYTRDFFANWEGYDGPLAEKIRLAIRNRTRAYFIPPIKGCCGHPGEPGC